MRKKVAGVVLAGALAMSAGPFATAAHANGDSDITDPVLCFVAAHSIITEALDEYRHGNLTGLELRFILVGASTFLGDCLTPTT